jgi:hypothetical protein
MERRNDLITAIGRHRYVGRRVLMDTIEAVWTVAWKPEQWTPIVTHVLPTSPPTFTSSSTTTTTPRNDISTHDTSNMHRRHGGNEDNGNGNGEWRRFMYISFIMIVIGLILYRYTS